MLACHEISDEELVLRAKGGDFAAFEQLITRSEKRVYALAFRMLGNHEDAQDVAQQTLMSAVGSLQSFRGEATFLTWLLRIATHAALKVIRKRKSLSTVSLEALTEEPDDYGSIPHPEYIADWRDSPEELVKRREVTMLLEETLQKLDEKYRLVFLLRDVEGFSVAETAETLGLTPANVKVRLLRARLQLREALTCSLGDPKTRIGAARHEL